MADLARRVSDSTSASTIDKIEKGKRRLTDVWIERFAAAFGVDNSEILIDRRPPASPGRHFAEDADPYRPPDGSLIAAAIATRENVVPWVVKTRVLSELGIMPGDVLLVDISASAVAALKPLDVVVAQVYDPVILTRATTVIRQFVPPGQLITNSDTVRMPALHIGRDNCAIKGVRVGTFPASGS